MFNPREITIGDRALFEAHIGKTENSTLNFTTLYIWSAGGNIKYDILDDCLVLFFYGKGKRVFCTYPKGNGDKEAVAKAAYRYMKEQSGKVRFLLMSEAEAKACHALFKGKLSVCSDPNNADYVYESESLITLSGKKLHQKRNHLNAFMENYDFCYERLDASHKDECMDLFSNWLHVVKNGKASFSEAATVRLLNHIEELPITMGGIRVDGKLIAFSAGEPLTEDMALIHMEYADTAIRGAFNAINQQFVLNEWKDYTFINREEDMGIAGLRRAKRAYRPVRMVEKYIAE